MSSIITTKRKSTITAPTYTSTSSSARNSAPSSIHSMAALANARIRCRTAVTGLRAVITRNAAITSTAASM
ncbi:hypothetical protein D9M68_845450 [compost metagenome]